jgi:hypothetical protein
MTRVIFITEFCISLKELIIGRILSIGLSFDRGFSFFAEKSKHRRRVQPRRRASHTVQTRSASAMENGLRQ